LDKRVSLLSVSITVVMLVALIISGCTQQAPAPSPAPSPAPTPAKWPEVISIGTSPSGGTYYVVGVGWADTVSKYVDITARGEATGGAEANLKLMKASDLELGIVNDMDAYYGPRGLAHWASEGKMPVRLLFKSHKFEMWTGTKVKGINSIEDLKGKKYMADWKGAPVMVSYAKPMLECYGFDTEKDITIQPTAGWVETVAAATEETASAVQLIGTHPAPRVVELTETVGLRLLSVSDEVLECVAKKIPWAAPSKIPAGTYKGQTEDVGDVQVWTNFTITPDLPEDLVYELAKATFTHLDELAAIHPALKQLNLKGALTNPQMPYHPGAVKYYKEAGVWTSEMEATQSQLVKEIGAG